MTRIPPGPSSGPFPGPSSGSSTGLSPGRRRRLLRRVRRRVDSWARINETGPTWISDTQLLFSNGAVLDLRNMLHLIETLPPQAEPQIVDHYLDGFQQSQELVQRYAANGEFAPEDVINHAVKVIVPAGNLGEIPTVRIDDDLSWAWALDFDGVLMMQPGEDLAAVVGHAHLEAAAEANITEHARQCDVRNFDGGIIVSGPSKVVPSVALYLTKCARILGLPACGEGYFLGMPSRTEIIVVWGDQREILPAILQANIDIFAQAAQRMSPWLFHTHGEGVITNLRDIPEIAHDDIWLGPWAS